MGGCTSGCMGRCMSGCMGGCTSGCMGRCMSGCMGRCMGRCMGGCMGRCMRGCTGVCMSGCLGGCMCGCMGRFMGSKIAAGGAAPSSCLAGAGRACRGVPSRHRLCAQLRQALTVRHRANRVDRALYLGLDQGRDDWVLQRIWSTSQRVVRCAGRMRSQG
eukprot:350728-Chlamydomonas_euryale.AAC.3